MRSESDKIHRRFISSEIHIARDLPLEGGFMYVYIDRLRHSLRVATTEGNKKSWARQSFSIIYLLDFTSLCSSLVFTEVVVDRGVGKRSLVSVVRRVSGIQNSPHNFAER